MVYNYFTDKSVQIDQKYVISYTKQNISYSSSKVNIIF